MFTLVSRLTFLCAVIIFAFSTTTVMLSQSGGGNDQPDNPWDPGPPIGFPPFSPYDENQEPCPVQTEGVCSNQAWITSGKSVELVHPDNPNPIQGPSCMVTFEYCYRCCNGIAEVFLKGMWASPSSIWCLDNLDIDLWDPRVRAVVDFEIHEAALDHIRRLELCEIDPYQPCDQTPINNVVHIRRYNAPCYKWGAYRRLVNGQYQYDYRLESCWDTDFCVETWRMCRNPITNEIDHIKVSTIPSSQICPSGNIFDDPRVPGALQQCFTICQ